MRTACCRLAVLVALVLAFAGTVGARDVPYLTGRVNDTAGMLPIEVRERLEVKLAELEKASGAQVVVLTITSLDGDPLEEYALKVGQTWKLGGRVRPHVHVDPAVALDRLDRIDDEVDQRLLELGRIGGERWQSGGHRKHDFNPACRRFGAQQFADIAGDLGDLDGLQVDGRGRRQAQKLPHEVFEAVQLAADDLEPADRLRLQRRGSLGHVLFEELHMNGQRAQRIADFVREAG